MDSNSYEIEILIMVVIPTLFIIFRVTTKGLFIDKFDPYKELKDIKSFNILRLPNGNGFKRFLAAIQYERTRNCITHVFTARNLIVGVAIYFLFILLIYNATLSSELFKNRIVAGLPFIKIIPPMLTAYLAWLGFQPLFLKNKIRR